MTSQVCGDLDLGAYSVTEDVAFVRGVAVLFRLGPVIKHLRPQGEVPEVIGGQKKMMPRAVWNMQPVANHSSHERRHPGILIDAAIEAMLKNDEVSVEQLSLKALATADNCNKQRSC